MNKRRKLWAEAFGQYGFRVRVEERRVGGTLYARLPVLPYRDDGPRYRDVSLQHADKERAKEWARTEAEKLRAGTSGALDPVPTAARVFARYVTETKPDKGESSQELDTRASAMWTRWLGADKDLSKLTPSEWRGFIRARASGEIDAQGKPVPEKDDEGNPTRKPVRTRTVENDCKWLMWVLNWATKERDADGHYLLQENSARGFAIPHEQNPRRPVATQDRYEALLAVADQVLMDVRRNKKRVPVRSYFRELLELVNGTARRISAVCQLRYEDLRLARSKTRPHGAIQWPGETDKMAKAFAAPLNATTRATIDRILSERPGIGAAYLFPKASDPTKPVGKDLVSDWLERAEQLAGLPKQSGTLWHAFRRKWGTERKHHPIQDVMAAGGWSDPTCLQTIYQQADPETVYRVVSEPAELREAK
ncbi:MAG TPA: site-specific integrase [Gemmatimonadales bacterium]|nr:site-specific integrase [Gemmatimonadales bacterium]